MRLAPSDVAVGESVVGQLLSNDQWVNGTVESVADGMVELSTVSGRSHRLPHRRVRRRVVTFRPPDLMPDITPKPMYRTEKVNDKSLLSIVTYCCQHGEDEELRRMGFTPIKLPDDTIMAFRRVKMGPDETIPCKISLENGKETNPITTMLYYLGCRQFKVTGIGEVSAALACCQIPVLRLIWNIKYDEAEYQLDSAQPLT